MTEQTAIVMDPDRTATPNHRILVAARLTTTTGKLNWRTEVSTWASSVERHAEGRETRSGGIVSALSITPYHAVDETFRSKLDRPIAAGILRLRPAENEDPKSRRGQSKL